VTIVPTCLIRGVRSVELAATNLSEASRFYEEVWGLRLVMERDGARLFRGTGSYHHILGLHCGPRPALLRVVFDVADRRSVDASTVRWWRPAAAWSTIRGSCSSTAAATDSAAEIRKAAIWHS
jgi:catechol 2,3-dioxygenase